MSLPRAPAGPGPLGAWLLVALLVTAYAVSFLDRQIVNLLVTDIKADLRLDDVEIGLLQGPAFGVFYALFGLPLGWLADRMHRLRLIAAGLLLWTTMTIFGGLADSFALLFVSRIGVGIGEAALVPAAVSLLADSFDKRERALPLAIFTSGVSIGAGLALVAGGALVVLTRQPGALAWIEPVVGDREPWQMVLILAGASGLPLVVLFLLTREPPRAAAELSRPREQGLTAHLRAHWSLFAAMLGGSALLYLYANALAAWLPSLFERGFGWSPAAAGTRLGLIIMVAALAGNIVSGIVARARERAGQRDGTLRVMVGGALLLAPLSLLVPLAGSPVSAQAWVGANYFAIALCFGVATAALAAVTPPHLRGRMTALYLMLGNLVGLGLGPPVVGALIEAGLGGGVQVAPALATVAALSVVPGALALVLALRWHARLAARVGR